MWIRRTNGHEYIYSPSSRQWIKVKCGCSQTAPVCPFPRTIPRGEMGGKRIKITDLDRHLYEERYDQAIMMLEEEKRNGGGAKGQ